MLEELAYLYLANNKVSHTQESKMYKIITLHNGTIASLPSKHLVYFVVKDTTK